MAENQRQVASAPVVIVLYTDADDMIANPEEIIHPGFDPAKRARILSRFQRNFAAESPEYRRGAAHGICYIALGYLLLAAVAMGYQTSPMLGFDSEGVKRLLKLPGTCTIPALVALGRGDEAGVPHHRHSVERITRFV